MYHQFITIYKHELHYWLRNPAFYCYALFFFLLIWSMIGGMSGETSQRWSGQLMNSPMYMQQMWNRLSIFIYLLLPAIVGLSIFRDYRTSMYHLFYAFPIYKSSYLAAKLLSSLTVLVIIVVLVGLGFFLGTNMSWSNPDVVGSFQWATYWQPFLWIIFPNLILVSMLVFLVVIVSRNIYAAFISVVLLLIIRVGLGNVLGGLDNAYWAALCDPFGKNAIGYYAAYWTVADWNTMPLPIKGVVIQNRLLWMGIVVLLGIFTYRRFSFSQEVKAILPNFPFLTKIASSKKVTTSSFQAFGNAITKVELPDLQYDFSFFQQLKTAWKLSNMDFRFVATSWPFIVLVTAGLSFLLFMISSGAIRFDTQNLPLTRILLDSPLYLFSALINIVTFLYAGLLINRARMANSHQLVDVTPIPNWTLLLSKFIALIKIQILLLALLMIGGIITQISKGFYHFEIGLYLFELYGINLIHFAIWAMLALFIQSLFTNPYLGFFITLMAPIGFIGLVDVGPKIGLDFLEQGMFRFNQGPGSIFGLPYSDMDGYGPILKPYFLYKIYWSILGLLLLLGALLFWVRGLPDNFKARLSIARFRLNRSLLSGASLLILAFIGLGASIFYENNVLNQYFSTQQQRDLVTKASKKYSHLRYIPQPKIVEVKVNMHLFPENRSFRSDGFYWIKNETNKALDTLVINYKGQLNIQYQFNRPTEVISQEQIADLGHFDILKLKQSLQVGDSLKMNFSLHSPPQTCFRTNEHIKASGTFMRDDVFPRFGNWLDYLRGQLQMNVHELKPHPTDSVNIQKLHDAKREKYIRFEAIVSTALDQIAITPGYLQREWTEDLEKYGQRRFFHYKMDKAINHSYMFASGKYAVLKDKWQDVNLEIYYHPDHHWNVERMMDGMKASLAYCSQNFSPYQFRQLRIVEFAQVGSASAHGYPNTIPFGEEAGFIADIDESAEGGIDIAFGGAVHEVAHQWWGHQVGSANALGAKMNTESTAEYVTVMVRKHQKGKTKARQYIRHNLDAYLKARTRERKTENPLMLSHPNQNYIHYPKGMIVFYSLADYLGEEKLNRAIQSYVQKVAFLEDGYTTSKELVDFIRRATPDSLQYLIKDMFETITFYDNTMLSASTKALPNGQYEVDMAFLVSKYRSVGKGKQVFQNEEGGLMSYQNEDNKELIQSLPLADYIEIGAFGKNGKELYLKKHKINSIKNRLKIIVDEKPEQVGVDPFHLLIDREMGDNQIKIGDF